MQPGLDVHVRQFIERRIPSLPALDVLALLAKDSSKPWALFDVTRELNAEAALVRQVMFDLVSVGLAVQVPKSMTFKLRESESEIMNKVLLAYEADRSAIVDVLMKRSLERLRALVEAYRTAAPARKGARRG